MRRCSASYLLVLVPLGLAACAADGFPGSGSPDAAGSGPDGGGFADANPFDPPDAPPYYPDGALDDGGGPDGTPGCFDVVITPPPGPARVEVSAHADGPGFLGAPTWRVTGPVGENVTVRYDDARHIRFTAGVHGVYQVVAEPACAPESVELAASPNEHVTFYLRYTPRPSEGVPPQDDPSGFEIDTGIATFPIGGARVLTRAFPIHATISGEVGVLGAQVTFLPAGPVGWPVSLFANLQREVNGPVLDLDQTVVIVPGDGHLAPYAFTRLRSDLDLASIPFTPGQQLTGTVVDANDVAVPDTWISVGADTLPPALVKTDSQGKFALDVRSGNLRFEVAPAAGSGLASLVVPPALQVRVDGGPVRIALANAPRVTLSGWQVKAADHVTFLGGAHVTFVAQVGAGKITQGGVTHVVPASETRVRVDTDAAGTLPNVTLPAARYDVIVEPPVATNQDVMAVTSLDLRGASSPVAGVLSTVLPASFSLEIVDADGQPLKRARVTAVAQGRFGVQKSAAMSSQADDVGKGVSFIGPPGMVYDLIVDAPGDSPTAHARAHVRVDSTSLIPTIPLRVQMPPTVVLSGSLQKVDGHNPAPGVTVSVHCGGNGCPDPDFIYAETTTDAAGAFTLAVPDLPRTTP